MAATVPTPLHEKNARGGGGGGGIVDGRLAAITFITLYHCTSRLDVRDCCPSCKIEV